MNGLTNDLKRLPDPSGGKLLKVLAIECTEKNGSVALLTASETYFLPLPRQLSTARSLAPAIKELLTTSKLAPRDLEKILVTCGPGSFTGLRIGIGLARAMAFGSDTPLQGISSLATMASDYAFPFKPDKQTIAPRFVTVLNAFRNELFVAAWSYDIGRNLVRLSQDRVISRQNLTNWARQTCESDDVLIVSPEAQAFFGESESYRLDPTAWGVINAALIDKSFTEGELDQVLPAYLRRSAAEEKRDAVASMAERS